MLRLFGLLIAGVLLLAQPARAEDGAAAEALVKQAIADAAASFAGGPFSREESRDKIIALVSKYGDITYESELILGRYWRKASQEQKDSFVSLLVPFFVATYAELIDNKSGATQVEVKGSEERADGVLVKARIIQKEEEGVDLSFIISRNLAGRLVISDAMAEGVGLITTIRSDFTSVIRNGGGNVDVLLDAMRKKIAALPAGGR
ncbi:ABC-type transport system involved in resistance to organic solvents auxiliary component [Paramagnetospirillum magnetotacticum MS-1]|uniref:ABC-type transport system involved in resistance to organic solvents auxiliary component n=1 Tax=Paramagnetospirillum magnetotacticum MS-1 TaxID=272627 RepID=A0A0C2U6D0_PARME|nr:ABC transporter substrate-binding protein [Paramagnetospirillum magnetotacticum]KIL97012.1 ABC-type transport system involved in resistance to organic solvents auxiliary component [Paramagnetospirillum magnetotacticum MS-1]